MDAKVLCTQHTRIFGYRDDNPFRGEISVQPGREIFDPASNVGFMGFPDGPDLYFQSDDLVQNTPTCATYSALSPNVNRDDFVNVAGTGFRFEKNLNLRSINTQTCVNI
jgi:hypothetical protein